MLSVHRSPYAGHWYPADAAALRELLANIDEKSRVRAASCPLKDALAFVVPHAGLVYSGTVAAAVYRYIHKSQPKRVIILGFSHSRRVRGIGIPDVDSYINPLGELVVDREAVDWLAGGIFRVMPEDELCDHSVEIQLPLLAASVPDTSLVPLYVGYLNQDQLAEAGRRIAGLAGNGTVILASSDFTHYWRAFHYTPFEVDGRIAERLEELDQRLMEAAGSLDPELFQRDLDSLNSTLCGYLPISLLLATLRAWAKEEVFQTTLDYQTSGELCGDYLHSVSYAALAYFPYSSFLLDLLEQQTLLSSARRTLEVWVRARNAGMRDLEGGSSLLALRTGVFVSLHRQGELRGCVGRIAGRKPLASSVADMAVAAASMDSRFTPLRPEELADCEIEISVLSPLKRIAAPDRFELGLHGVRLEVEDRCGVLLPQVALRGHWDRERFLAAVAQKAGLSPAAIHDPETRLHIFRAQVFAEQPEPTPGA